MKINLVDILRRNIPVCITKRCVINFIVVFVARSGVSLVIRLPLLYQGMLVGFNRFNQGLGIRGEIIVPARRLELKHDATEVELTSTVRFL